MKAPILDPSFRWIPAASHSDSTAFRERQLERMRQAQQKPALTPFQRKQELRRLAGKR